MPSTYTDNLGIEKIANGEQSGTWGDTTNLNFDILDQAVNGIATVTLASAGSSGAPNTLPITDGALSNGRAKFIEFTDGGDLGATAYVQLTPNNAEKIVFIRNSLSGSRSVILFQGTYDSGRDLEIAAGVDMIVRFEGGGSVSTVENVSQNLRVEALQVNGNIVVGGTVDGRNVLLDGLKLDGIEPLADVTDTANVTAAGALMDSELTNLAAVKAINQQLTTTSSPTFAAATVNGNITVTGTVDGRDIATDGSKLDGIEANADVTDTANVTAAGALMDSELTNLAAVKAINQQLTTTSSPTFAAATVNGNITVTGTVDGRDIATDGSKLDGIEANADVTDTANVTAAGALMDSELTDIAAVKDLDQGVATTDSPSFAGLTVDTNTLYVDSANNRVGVRTASPSHELVVAGTARVGTGGSSADMKLSGAVTPAVTVGGSTTAAVISNFGTGGAGWHIGIEVPSNDANDGFYVATDADNDGTVDTLAMKIKADGSVGIKTASPAGDFHVNGTVFMPALSTTALGANMRMFSGTTGEVAVSTSSIRYKTDVEDANDTLSEAIVYNSRPIWYRSLSEIDPDDWSFWGFIAEELHEIDPRLVNYAEDENGELVPDGVQYDRFVVHLVNVAQQQKARIDDLEARLAALEARL